jgi:hypothetical protein
VCIVISAQPLKASSRPNTLCAHTRWPMAHPRAQHASCPGRNLGLGRHFHHPPRPKVARCISATHLDPTARRKNWRNKNPLLAPLTQTLIHSLLLPIFSQSHDIGVAQAMEAGREEAAPPHGPCQCARSPSWLSVLLSRGRVTVPWAPCGPSAMPASHKLRRATIRTVDCSVSFPRGGNTLVARGDLGSVPLFSLLGLGFPCDLLFPIRNQAFSQWRRRRGGASRHYCAPHLDRVLGLETVGGEVAANFVVRAPALHLSFL